MLQNLQRLRGVAALLVVLFHLTPHLLITNGLTWATNVTKYGFFGVDIFFILSGLVIGISNVKINNNTNNVSNFIKKRITRIYLGYWPPLIFTFLIYTIYFDYKIPDLKIFINSLLLVKPTIDGNILPTAWSLVYELYFYLIVAGVIYWFREKRLVVISTIICAVCLWNAWWWLSAKPLVINGDQPLKFFMSAYVVEFCLGWLLALTRPHKLNASFAVYFCLFVCAFSVSTTNELFDRVELLRVGSLGLAAYALVYVTLCLDEAGKFNTNQDVLSKLGDSSYSLYLLHPVLIELIPIFKRLVNGEAMKSIVVVLVVVGILYLSYFWYRIIEKPLYERALKYLLKTSESSAKPSTT